MKTFPVLWQGGRVVTRKLEALECPRSVPWAFVADHAAQCDRNHSQSPETLAERGGLAPCELVAVVEDRRWHRMTEEDAVARLKTLLEAASSPS